MPSAVHGVLRTHCNDNLSPSGVKTAVALGTLTRKDLALRDCFNSPFEGKALEQGRGCCWKLSLKRLAWLGMALLEELMEDWWRNWPFGEYLLAKPFKGMLTWIVGRTRSFVADDSDRHQGNKRGEK